MSTVHLRYWAGAKAAAGRAEESVEAGSVGEALALVCAAHADERFSRVVRACSVLVDGAAAHEADLARPLDGPVRVELLPPFAGGAVDGVPVVHPEDTGRACAVHHLGTSRDVGCTAESARRPDMRTAVPARETSVGAVAPPAVAWTS